jgi:hypothetical protein
MSFLGTIGGALGAIGSAKSIFGSGSTVDVPKQVYGRVRGAMRASEDFGIHPLEILRSGTANVGSGGTPRVGSVAAMSNAFDQIQDAVSGKTAAEAERAIAEAEIAKNEAENLTPKAGELPQGVRSAPKPVNNGRYPYNVAEVPVMPGEPILPRIVTDAFPSPTGGVREVVADPVRDLPATQTVTLPGGDVRTVGPETPGIDETFGYAIHAMPQRWAQENPEANRAIRDAAEGYTDGDMSNNFRHIPLLTPMMTLIDEMYDTYGKPR